MFKSTTVFATIVICFIAITSVTAQGNEPLIPDPPARGKYILDSLNWLNDVQENEIVSISQALRNKGVGEIFVVTQNDCGNNKTAFRKELFESWDIGHPVAKDGLLILVCWYDGDESRRSVEQQYGGGLEHFLSNDLTDQITREQFVPAFEKGKPGDGIVEMIKKYDSIIRKQYDALITNSRPSSLSIENLGPWIMMIVIMVLATVFVGLSKGRSEEYGSYGVSEGNENSGYGGGESGGGGDGGGGDDGGGSSSDF